MADRATAMTMAAGDWSGGVHPYAISHKKLGMWLFILSDSLTFSALLVGYAYVRVAAKVWPTPFHFWPSVVTATVMTLVLLSSSLTMVMAVGAAVSAVGLVAWAWKRHAAVAAASISATMPTGVPPPWTHPMNPG